MNRIKTSAIAAVVLGTGLMSGAATAAEKIGIVNVQGVFQSLPQAAAIQEDIRAEFKDQIEEISRLEKDIKYYLEKQQRDAATMSDAEKTELQEKLVGLRDDYQSKTKPLQQNIQRRQMEERDKLLGLIQQAINNIAEEQNYDLILNANAVAYMSDDADNLSKEVIDKVSAAN